MKINRDQDELQRQTLSYELGEYDAQPSAPVLIVDRVLSQAIEPRMGLAEALAYWSSASGPVDTQDHLAPATLEVLRELPGSGSRVITNVHWKYADVRHGSLEIRVDDCLPGYDPGSHMGGTSAQFALHLPDTGRAAGSMTLLRDAWIPTNAAMVGSSPSPGLDRMHRRLAVLLMVSGDLDASGFTIPLSWVHDLDTWSSYQLLFKTVGLDLGYSKTSKDPDHV